MVVNSKEITDAGMKSVGALKSLTKLDIIQARLTEKGLTALTGLTNLKELYLHGADVRDGDVEPLKQMGHLSWLSLPTALKSATLDDLQVALPRTRVI